MYKKLILNTQTKLTKLSYRKPSLKTVKEILTLNNIIPVTRSYKKTNHLSKAITGISIIQRITDQKGNIAINEILYQTPCLPFSKVQVYLLKDNIFLCFSSGQKDNLFVGKDHEDI